MHWRLLRTQFADRSLTRRSCSVSVGVTPGSRRVSWHWPDVREQALELTATCKSAMRWNSFLGGQTTYMNNVLIKVEYRGGHGLTQNASAGDALNMD